DSDWRYEGGCDWERRGERPACPDASPTFFLLLEDDVRE
ncbi:hypothetical protein GBAR_LOCUS4060, partial [Geodia barretti]